MAFRYTRPPLTQGLLPGAILVGALALGSAPAARELWAVWVRSLPEWVLLLLVPWLLHKLVFWGSCAVFHYVDKHDRPAFIARHRTQTGPARQPPMPGVLRRLAWNQLLWSPVMMVIMWGGLALQGWAPSEQLPTVATLIKELALLSLWAVAYFYVTHRALHHPWWMKRVHRIHHEFRTTRAVAAEYAHPVEFTMGNFMTVVGGILVFSPSLPAIYLFIVLAILNVQVHHSGYALPWASWSVHHNWHHYRYKECFGVTGVLDRVLGTDPEFRELEDGQVVGR